MALAINHHLSGGHALQGCSSRSALRSGADCGTSRVNSASRSVLGPAVLTRRNILSQPHTVIRRRRGPMRLRASAGPEDPSPDPEQEKEEEQKKKYEERQLALERELLDAAKGSALLLTRLVSLVVLGRWYFDQHESLLLEILGGHRTSTFVDAIRAGSVDWSAYIEPLLEKGLGAKSVFDLFDVAQKALIAGSNILEERVRRFGKL